MSTGRSWSAPSSRRSNLVALLAALAALAGVALGRLLPWETWRSGGEVVLGDFALLCLLGAVAWRWLLPETGGGGIARLGTIVTVTAGTLAVREVAWRWAPAWLGVLHGVAVCTVVVLFIGPPALDLAQERTGGAAPAWSAETIVRLGLGLVIAAWTVVACL